MSSFLLRFVLSALVHSAVRVRSCAPGQHVFAKFDVNKHVYEDAIIVREDPIHGYKLTWVNHPNSCTDTQHSYYPDNTNCFGCSISCFRGAHEVNMACAGTPESCPTCSVFLSGQWGANAQNSGAAGDDVSSGEAGKKVSLGIVMGIFAGTIAFIAFVLAAGSYCRKAPDAHDGKQPPITLPGTPSKLTQFAVHTKDNAVDAFSWMKSPTGKHKGSMLKTNENVAAVADSVAVDMTQQTLVSNGQKGYDFHAPPTPSTTGSDGSKNAEFNRTFFREVTPRTERTTPRTEGSFRDKHTTPRRNSDVSPRTTQTTPRVTPRRSQTPPRVSSTGTPRLETTPRGLTMAERREIERQKQSYQTQVAVRYE